MFPSRQVLAKIGTRSTKLVGMYFGEKFPFWYVSEFPRSGGTWFAKMVADYLQIPKPTRTVFPMGCECVVQNHWTFSPRLKRVFYVVRDGRDVAVSSYFFLLKGLASKENGIEKYFRRHFPIAANDRWSPEDITRVFPDFLEAWCRRPIGTRTTWGSHVRQWAFDRPNVYRIKYEDLVANTLLQLTSALSHHGVLDIRSDRIAATVEKFSFKNQTGRSPGQASPLSHNRNGVPGEWKKIFCRRSAEIFGDAFGDELVRLGYEGDQSWVEGCRA